MAGTENRSPLAMSKIKDLSTHYTRPDWVRRINAMGDSVGGPQNLIPLEPEALIEGAIASTAGTQ